jgi:hypothetical protein
MITHDARRSLSRGNNPVPSPWQATVVARNSTGKRWVAGQLPLWLPNETVFRHDRHWNCA